VTAAAPADRGLRGGVVNIAAALTIVLIAGILLKTLRVVLEPFFIAVFLFYLAGPAVHALVKRRVPTGIAHLIVLALSASALILFAGLFIERVDDLGRRLPAFQERLQEVATATASGVSTDLPFFRRHARGIMKRVDILTPATKSVARFTTGLLSFCTGTLLVTFYLIFLIQEQKTLPARLVSIYGKDRADQIREVGDRINRSIARYMYIKFLASVFTAVGALIVMWAFKLELAVLWAFLLFVLNFIPYFGSIIAFLFPLAIGVLQFDEIWKVFLMGGLFLAIDSVVGNYWEPRVAGSRLNVSPLVVLLALAFWGWIWGTVGMILAVPITVSLRYVLENIPYTRSLAVLLANEPASTRAV